MRILNINKFHYINGGSDRHYFTLTNLLKSKGHEVFPFAMQSPRNEATRYSEFFVSEVKTKNVSLDWQGIRTAARVLWSFEAARKLKRLISVTKPDVAVIQLISHQISPSILPVLKKANIPTVMILHDFKLMTPVYNLHCPRCVASEKGDVFNMSHVFRNKSIKNSYLASALCIAEHWLHKITKVYQKNVDLFIAPSYTMANIIKNHLPEANVETLPNFLQADINTNQKNNASKHLLYTGRLEDNKGIWTLLDAMRLLPNDVILHIAGQGGALERVNNYITEIKSKQIKLFGWLSSEELNKQIADSSMVVVPSDCFEIQPYAILEAFAHGKPVIAAKSGGIPELVRDGQDGFLFEPGNAVELANKIKTLILDPKKRLIMGESAKQRLLTKYSANNYYRKLMGLIDSLDKSKQKSNHDSSKA